MGHKVKQQTLQRTGKLGRERTEQIQSLFFADEFNSSSAGRQNRPRNIAA
jgi:hypothetical protein